MPACLPARLPTRYSMFLDVLRDLGATLPEPDEPLFTPRTFVVVPIEDSDPERLARCAAAKESGGFRARFGR
jgi:hypothetical protein